MVEFHSRLDSSKTDALNKNTFKRLWWLFALVSVLFIALGIIGLIVREDSEDLYYAIFCLTFGVCFTPLVWLISKPIQKSLNKSTAYVSDNTEEVYTFDEEGFTITQKKTDEFSAMTQAKYSYLYKVIENNTHYFLYISKTQCHVVDKASITQGSLDELNAIFARQLGSKYKCKNVK